MKLFINAEIANEVDKLILKYGLAEHVQFHNDKSEEQKGMVIHESDVVLSLPMKQKYSLSIFNSLPIGKPVVLNRNYIQVEQ